MNDIVITAKRLRQEGLILLGCFLFSFLLNVISIAVYKTEWIELLTQLVWVVVLSLFFYSLLFCVRFLFSFFKRILVSKKRS